MRFFVRHFGDVSDKLVDKKPGFKGWVGVAPWRTWSIVRMFMFHKSVDDNRVHYTSSVEIQGLTRVKTVYASHMIY